MVQLLQLRGVKREVQECALPGEALDPEPSLNAYTPPPYPLPCRLTCMSAESLRAPLHMYAARHAFTQYSIDTDTLRNNVLCHREVALYLICRGVAFAVVLHTPLPDLRFMLVWLQNTS